MRIGNLVLSSSSCSAPLAGLSSIAWRIILHEMGCPLTFSEMVSSDGLIRGQTRTKKYLENIEFARPFSVQIFGINPASMRDAVMILDGIENVDMIDINMGCPVKKVVSRGAGSALMKDPNAVAKIVKAVRSATKKPVTAKIRAGWDDDHINCVDIGLIIEDNGADAVIVHPRTRTQQFGGKARWELIGEVKKSVKIPVIGNGDIKSYDDAMRMFKQTGCDGVMIGRGALGNPWIFESIKQGRDIIPDLGQRRDVILKHFELMLKYFGERYACVHIRSILPWYVKGIQGSRSLLCAINRMTNSNEIVEKLNMFFV